MLSPRILKFLNIFLLPTGHLDFFFAAVCWRADLMYPPGCLPWSSFDSSMGFVVVVNVKCLSSVCLCISDDSLEVSCVKEVRVGKWDHVVTECSDLNLVKGGLSGALITIYTGD